MSMTTTSMFEDKHKPQRFTDLVLAHDAVRQKLALYAQYQMHGNLLLHGPYGTAKSVTARVIVQERLIACGIPDGNLALVHALAIKSNVMQVENHINLLLTTNWADRHPYLVVDEIDQLTALEQKQLRAVLDTYTVVKLIGTTNHLHDVDGGLCSRSDCVSVMPPAAQDWLSRARQILAAENVVVADAALLAVLGLSQDARELMRKLEEIVIRTRNRQAQAVVAPVVSLVPNAVTPVMCVVAVASTVAPVVSMAPNPGTPGAPVTTTVAPVASMVPNTNTQNGVNTP